MRFRSLFLFLLLMASFLGVRGAHAQTRYDWRHRLPGSAAHRETTGAAVLTGGDLVFSTGAVLGTAAPATLECVDPRGNPRWSITPSAPDGGTDLYLEAVASAPDGTFYAAGRAGYPTPFGYSAANVVLLHVAADGTVLGGGRIPDYGNCLSYRLKVSADGSVYLMAYWGNFGDAAVSRWNADATLAWNHVFDSGTTDSPVDFEIDADGSVAALYQSRPLANPNLFITRVEKIAPNGVRSWVNGTPLPNATTEAGNASSQVWGADIAIGTGGDVYICGRYRLNTDPTTDYGFINGFRSSDGLRTTNLGFNPLSLGLKTGGFQALGFDAFGAIYAAGAHLRTAQNDWKMTLMRYRGGVYSIIADDGPNGHYAAPDNMALHRLSDGSWRVVANTYVSAPGLDRGGSVWHLRWGDDGGWALQLLGVETAPMGFATRGFVELGDDAVAPFGPAYIYVPEVADYRWTPYVGRLATDPLPIPTYTVLATAPRRVAVSGGLEGLFDYGVGAVASMTQPQWGTVGVLPGVGFDWTPNGSGTTGDTTFGVSFTYGPEGRTDTGLRSVRLKVRDFPRPALRIVVDPNSSWTTSARVSILATDTGGGIERIEYRVNGVASTVAGSSVEFTLDGEGDYDIDAIAVDSAGQESDRASARVQIDDTAPDLRWGYSPTAPDGANGWYRSAVTATFAATDARSGVATVSPPALLPQGRGVFVTGTATDRAGNNATVSTAPVNIDTDAPVATAQSVQAFKATPVGIVLSGTDTLSGVASFQIVSGPSNGTLTGTAPNLTYTPTGSYTGPDSFTFVVTDEAGNRSVVATVSITVSAPNKLPVAKADTARTVDGGEVEIAVLANDSDPDGDPLTVTQVSTPTLGTARIRGSLVVYTPTSATATGTDTFTYTVSDGRGGSASATVTVNLTVNRPPVAKTDNVSTTVGVPITIDVLANDSDPDGDPISMVSFTGTANGTLTRNADGTFRYVPRSGYIGKDSFTYTIVDGRGGTATGTVSITVKR